MATKITALVTAASAAAGMRTVVVSGSTNKQIWFGRGGGGDGLLGGVVFATEATVAASATANIAVLASCDVIDFYVRALVGSSAAAAGTVVQIGVAADQVRFGSITVSAVGLYRPAVVAGASALSMRNFTGTITAVAPTATAAAVFMVGAQYVKR